MRIGVISLSRMSGRTLNFHGITIPVQSLTRIWAREDRLEGADRRRRRARAGAALPARHDIVRNAFARELHAKVKRTIYEVLAAMTPAPELPDKAWVEARRLGIDYPEPRPQLERWRPAPADQVRHAPADPHAVTPNPDTDVLMNQVWETSFTGLVARAAKRGAGGQRLLRSESAYHGYGWYDRQFEATDARVEVTAAGKT